MITNMKHVAKYRHYKGGMYQAINVATNSETLEVYMVYKSLETEEVWVRPYDMFFDELELVNGEKIKRFERVGN